MFVRFPDIPSESVQPAVGCVGRRFTVSDGVPDAGEPVSDQAEDEDEEYKHRRTILDVMIQLAGHSPQTEKTHHFQGTEETADTLQLDKNEKFTYWVYR